MTFTCTLSSNIPTTNQFSILRLVRILRKMWWTLHAAAPTDVVFVVH